MAEPTHAERVAAAVPDDCKLVALLHDAIEDGHLPPYAFQQLRAIDGGALTLITRWPRETYGEYIRHIAEAATSENRDMRAAGRIALLVKIADLRDNLNRPEGPPPGDLKKRYEKALDQLERQGER